MSDAATNHRQTVFPALRYADANAAIDWLVSAFGFEKGVVVADDAGVIAHAELWMNAGVVMLGQQNSPSDGASPQNQSIYVAVDDADVLCARAKAAGAEVLSEPFDTDYGSREFGARDLEGFRWDFGTYRPERP